MPVAITRHISEAIGACELTHLDREPIDVERARRQHAAYVDLLRERGWTVEELAAADVLPDCVFVEDTAFVTPDVAVLARPGAGSRRPEVPAVAERLRRHCEVVPIEAPATLDGGDVLVLGRRVWIGLSRRTSEAAVEQVRAILEPRGYEVAAAPVTDCLHFKSAVTAADAETVVVNPAWIDATLFDGLRVVEVDPAEPFAANVLRLNDVTVVPADAPRTRARLESAGIACVALDASELAKAEGGLTCCSLLISSESVSSS